MDLLNLFFPEMFRIPKVDRSMHEFKSGLPEASNGRVVDALIVIAGRIGIAQVSADAASQFGALLVTNVSCSCDGGATAHQRNLPKDALLALQRFAYSCCWKEFWHNVRQLAPY